MSWTDYKRLLDERDTDPGAWAAAAKANPNGPLTACKVAVEADPGAAADLLLLFARRAPALRDGGRGFFSFLGFFTE